ncbi:MAG: sigma-70 family RNA polymerase sigma factor [Pseudomonadota bacterium]
MTCRPSSFAIDVPDALLARMRQGEPAAFEQVYRWFERPVFTLALRICGEREQAADVLQDTMLKVIDRIGEFRGRGTAEGAHSPFWGWLRQIAVNEALMTLRRRRRPGQDGDHLDDVDAIDEHTPPPPAAADAARLQRALEALPANTRTVLWLYHAEGYTHDEIAALMQRTASFSKSQLARGGRRLRELLEPTTAVPSLPSLREAAHG